jgi:hypothetical protein
LTKVAVADPPSEIVTGAAMAVTEVKPATASLTV